LAGRAVDNQIDYCWWCWHAASASRT